MPVPAGGDGSTDLYTDLPTVKASLTKSNTDRDDLIDAAIRAACRWIDKRTGRRFYADTTATARTFPVHGNYLFRGCEQVLLIDDIAAVEGLAVATGSTGSWTTTTAWETGPDNALAKGNPITELTGARCWLPGTGRVQVTAVWGWPAVPDEIAQAAVLLAVRLYARRNTPEGVMNSAEWGGIRVSKRDPDVEALIEAFIVPAMA